MPSYAVCVATCVYCGRTWRPLVEVDQGGGFACDLECPRCGGGKTGRVRYVVGIEPDEASARARAELLVREADDA